jgi:hypothetical protein
MLSHESRISYVVTLRGAIGALRKSSRQRYSRSTAALGGCLVRPLKYHRAVAVGLSYIGGASVSNSQPRLAFEISVTLKAGAAFVSASKSVSVKCS